MKDIQNIISEIKSISDQLESGNTYSSEYVIERFEKAAAKNSTDLLINYMRDVLKKRAKVQYGFSQDEIGKLYNEMVGLGGGNSTFRDTLGDLLPEELHLKDNSTKKVSSLRVDSETVVKNHLYNQDLTDAFANIFDLNRQKKVAKIADDAKIKKAVGLQLQSLNNYPSEIIVGENNEHFVLATAIFLTNSLKKIAVQIPVEVHNNTPVFPDAFIGDGELIPLDEVNLLSYIHEKEADEKYKSQYKFASHTGELVSIKAETPQPFKVDVSEIEAKLLASSNFSQKQIFAATKLVDSELKHIGAVNPQIKLANSDQFGVVLDATVQTPQGKSTIQIPVEFHNGNPIMPSEFSPANESASYEFDSAGYSQFVNSLSNSSPSVSFTRANSELKHMNYHQLVDKMIDGVSNEDLPTAEDALLTIQAKFGTERYKEAVNKYSTLLLMAANSVNENDLIKSAIARGDLIRVPTSVELYHAKLKMPLSKLEFDEDGNLFPKGRVQKSANQRDEAKSLGYDKIKLF